MVADPVEGDVVEVFGERGGPDPVVVEVGVEAGRVAVSQLEGRVGFPLVAEAVDRVELDRAAGGAQLGEHPAAGDGLELVWVTDQRQPPVALIGELGEEKVAGGEHPGLVDDQSRAGGEPPARFGWPVVTVVFVEQFGDRVASHAGLGFEDTGRFRGRRQPERRATLRSEIVDGGAQHRRLAGASRADHEHETVVTGDSGAASHLHHVQPSLDRGRAAWRVELGVDRPRQHVLLLGEHASLV